MIATPFQHPSKISNHTISNFNLSRYTTHERYKQKTKPAD